MQLQNYTYTICLLYLHDVCNKRYNYIKASLEVEDEAECHSTLAP
jgi:hypothetical protein